MKGHERLMTIKTTGLRTVGKVLLWVLVIFLLFRGVVSILDNKSQGDLTKIIDDYKYAAEQREAARSGAAAFAENFIYEYYSFDGRSNSDYADRISRYLADTLNIPKPMGGGAATEVLSAKTVKINILESDDKMDVDVSVKVRYSAVNVSEGAISDKDINIRVPVAYKDGKYAVDAMPLFIPAEDAADIARATEYSGTGVSQKEEKEIKQILESFFKTYYEGSDQEVTYYLSDQSEIDHGLNGVVIFSGVKRISAYYLEGSDEYDEYLVNAVVSVADNGQAIDQEMYLYLTKTESKYYINEITTRIK
ncbi:MAG: conjugal transfer protein [Eubacteriales bacterium]|nr:conjugal transfer protein [Eubacteriales bacterium]